MTVIMMPSEVFDIIIWDELAQCSLIISLETKYTVKSLFSAVLNLAQSSFYRRLSKHG